MFYYDLAFDELVKRAKALEEAGKREPDGSVQIPGGAGRGKLSKDVADALFNPPPADDDADPAAPPRWLTG